MSKKLKPFNEELINGIDFNSLELISQGAEAKIFIDPEKKWVIKKRIPKAYRIPEIDTKLRKQRTLREVRILMKLSNIINVPRVIAFNSDTIIMEYIDGIKLRDYLNEINYKHLLKEVGKIVAKLHQNDIIHQDLTTSNMILFNDRIYLIDFGLSFISTKIEDKGVDLHLFKEALNSKHYNLIDGFNAFLEGYKEYLQFELVLKRLNEIEKRGRYKHK